MIGPALVVRHECPQCGAGLELGEADRLLVCPYCRVRLLLYCAGPRWLFLPARAGAPEDVFYVPYWRFRGARYVLGGASVTGAMVDHSLRAARYEALPGSLGVRPQVMVSRFVRADAGLRIAPVAVDESEYLGRLRDALWMADRIKIAPLCSLHDDLRISAPPADALGSEISFGIAVDSRPAYEPFDTEAQAASSQHFIGETVTMLCAPFFRVGGAVHDAVTGEVAGAVTGDEPAPVVAPGTALRFHASLCPECGHDLEGGVQTLVVVCTGCGAAWQASASGLVSAPYEIIESDGSETSWVPFWRITVATPDLALGTLRDLLRFINQSMPLSADRQAQPLAFWIPATKARPEAFLRWARIATLRQRPTVGGRLPEATQSELHPINLPVTEAIESVRVVLAAMCTSRWQAFSAVRRGTITARSFRLVMVPFRRSGGELTQPAMGFSMQSAALGWGKDM